jgi:hypothetical protein
MCAQNGKYMGTYAPFGYKKDPQNKHRFVIDESTAPIVGKIFALRIDGKGYKAIASYLNECGIIPPRDYYYQGKNTANPLRINHFWCDTTVKTILSNEAYIGNLIQGKEGTVSYKNKARISKPKDDWVRAEGTHEALIDSETWAQAQKISEKRYKPREQKDGKASIFSSLLNCADCGYKMRITTKNRPRSDGSIYHRISFICGNYARSGKTACSTHFIGEEVLHELVVRQIREHAQMVELNEEKVVESILRLQNSESETNRTAYTSELKSHETRLTALDRLIEKLYEDRLSEKITEKTFINLIQKYEKEQIERQQTAENLEKRIQNIRHSKADASKWAGMIKKYTQLEKLDAQTLLLLVDRIEVGEVSGLGGSRVCDIKVVYNYVGGLEMTESANDSGTPEGTEAAYEQAV